MQYLPLYLQCTLPIVSEYHHSISNIILVNKEVIKHDMLRYVCKNYRYIVDINTDSPRILYIKYIETDIYDLIYFAARRNYINTLKYVIKYSVKCGSVDSNKFKQHILVEPCYTKNSLETIRYLVEYGAPVDASEINDRRFTPLIAACYSKQPLEVIQYLVESGVKQGNTAAYLINQVSDNLETAIEYSYYSLNVMRYLIENSKCDDSGTSIKYSHVLNKTCTYCKSHDVLEYLLEYMYNNNIWIEERHNQSFFSLLRNTDVTLYMVKLFVTWRNKQLRNQRNILNVLDKHDKNTVLHTACARTSFEIVKYLVSSYKQCHDKRSITAFMNAVNNYKETAIVYACIHKDASLIVPYLLKNGAMLIHDGDKSILNSCIHKQPLELIKTIASYTSIKKATWQQALLTECRNNKFTRFDVIQYMLEHTGINITYSDGSTPFMYAFINSQPFSVIKWLVDYIRDRGITKLMFDHQNREGDTALIHACGDGNNPEIYKIVEYMVEEHGLPDNVPVLHKACNCVSDFNVIKYLVNKGASVNTKDSYGKTPLLLLCSNRDHTEDAIRYLMNYATSDTINDAFNSVCCTRSIELMRYFIDGHANGIASARVNTTNNTTPLGFTCIGNKPIEHAKLLIEYGAVLNYSDIERACTFSLQVDVVKYFISHYTETVSSIDKSQYIDLFNDICFWNPRFDIIKYFIDELHVDVNGIGGSNNTTPLINLCYTRVTRMGSHMTNNTLYIQYMDEIIQVAKYMLEHGADPTIKTTSPKSSILNDVYNALDTNGVFALSCKHKCIMRKLLKKFTL